MAESALTLMGIENFRAGEVWILSNESAEELN